jgi:hypothetical protein
MSTDLVSWIGGLACTGAGVAFTFMALYNRKQGGYRLPLWLLVPAFVFALQQFGQLRDIGTYARLDGINYNYFRQFGFAVSMLFTGVSLGSYQWFDFADGWGVNLLGIGYASAILFSGLTSDDSRFIMFATGLIALVLYTVLFLWRMFQRDDKIATMRRALPDGPEANGWRRFMQFVCIIGFILVQFANAFVHLMSYDMTRYVVV